MFMFLDCETSGLIRRDLDIDDPAQPFAVKIAAEHTQADGTRLSAIDLLIQPAGRAIKPGALGVHGITSRVAELNGLRENTALIFLSELAAKTRVVVTYGDFDPQIINSLLMRLENSLSKPRGTYLNRWARPGLQFLNIQHPACQQACRLVSEFETGEYRWPSLDQASEIILGEKAREGHHDAWDDLSRTKRLFFALREKGHFPLLSPSPQA